MSGVLLRFLLGSTLAGVGAPAPPPVRGCHAVDVLSDDSKSALPFFWDRLWDCVDLPWTDPDDPIVNPSPALQPLVFYQAVGLFEPLWMRRLADSVELSAPKIVTGQSCLPLVANATVQDQWEIDVAAATQVTIALDVLYANVDCSLSWGGCPTGLPAPARGPLDAKIAVYPPGAAPTAGPFNGLFDPRCADTVTGETGCSGKPTDACILCDNADCSLAGSTVGTCAQLRVDLAQPGVWTIAVTAQVPAADLASEGCYQLRLTGTELGVLILTAEDVAPTF